MTEPAAEIKATNYAELVARMRGIADEVAVAHAGGVDTDARFPQEVFNALRDGRLLSAGVSAELGGSGCNLEQLGTLCFLLAQRCASSAMILAMHYIQVACIDRHRGTSQPLADYLSRLAAEQRLIASVTSEVGTDGDMRRSIAALEIDGTHIACTKQATTVSYGAYADDLLITARRAADAPNSDQRLLLALAGGYQLQTTSEWDTLGMRGTCSPGGNVDVTGETWQILPAPFGDIAAATMVPVSHILWASCWLGIAADAAARARALMQRKVRGSQGAPHPAAVRLATLDSKLQLMRHDIDSVAREYSDAAADRRLLTSIGLAIRVNNLKLNASSLVVEIVTEAIEICGISAYRNDSEFSLGRHLRDALSAPLMISNDRIRQNTSTLQMVYKNR